jgi:hypothetical protein
MLRVRCSFCVLMLCETGDKHRDTQSWCLGRDFSLVVPFDVPLSDYSRCNSQMDSLKQKAHMGLSLVRQYTFNTTRSYMCYCRPLLVGLYCVMYSASFSTVVPVCIVVVVTYMYMVAVFISIHFCDIWMAGECSLLGTSYYCSSFEHENLLPHYRCSFGCDPQTGSWLHDNHSCHFQDIYLITQLSLVHDKERHARRNSSVIINHCD